MPRRYRVILTDAAEAERNSLSPHPKREIKKELRKLNDGTDRPNVKPLEGVPDTWTVRVNRLRIVFELYRQAQIIQVIRIRPRPTAYEGIERPPRSDRSPR